MSRRTTWTALSTAALVLAAPTAAQAAKKTVLMGPPPAAQKSLMKSFTDVNAFFPSSIAIHAGDTVSFVPNGFHSIDIPGPGGRPLQSFGPTAKKAKAIDAAGSPFWFDGRPEIGFNPLLLRNGFGKTVTKGAKPVLSGLPLGPPKPFTVRFPKAGLYRYVCDIHSYMKGSVRVRAKGAPIPSAKLDAVRVKKQVASALAVAKALAARKTAPANTIRVGADGKGGVHQLAFSPTALTVPAGTTVTFAMPSVSTDAHTATFGPGAGEPEKTYGRSYLGKLSKSYEGPAPSALATYPSEAPGTPPVALSSELHGNGFWSAGILDGDARSPLPSSGAVKFDTAGSYKFVCLIHPFMNGTITVQ